MLSLNEFSYLTAITSQFVSGSFGLGFRERISPMNLHVRYGFTLFAVIGVLPKPQTVTSFFQGRLNADLWGWVAGVAVVICGMVSVLIFGECVD